MRREELEGFGNRRVFLFLSYTNINYKICSNLVKSCLTMSSIENVGYKFARSIVISYNFTRCRKNTALPNFHNHVQLLKVKHSGGTLTAPDIHRTVTCQKKKRKKKLLLQPTVCMPSLTVQCPAKTC